MITIFTGYINEEDIKEIREIKNETKNAENCKIYLFPENGKHPKDIFKTAIKLALDDDEKKDKTIIITFDALVIEAIDTLCECVMTNKNPEFYLKDNDGLRLIDVYKLYEIYDNLYEGGFDKCDEMQLTRRLPSEFREKYSETNHC